MGRWNCSHLLQHAELVPIVPGLDNLSSGDSGESHGGDNDTPPGRRQILALPGMGSRHNKASCYLVILNNAVFDVDSHIGHHDAQVSHEDLERLRSDRI